MGTSGYRAVLLDRDGTLVHPFHYPSHPEHLRLYDTIGPELYTLQKMGFRLSVITNQAGIAHGYFTEDDLHRMNEYLISELSVFGVHLDGVYYCPHHPQGKIPALTRVCECRKPQPGMLLRAAADLDLDLERSWFVGDILDDVEAGNRAGCHTILVDLGTESPPQQPLRSPTFVARTTRHALEIIRAVDGIEESRVPSDAVELDYFPASWQGWHPQWRVQHFFVDEGRKPQPMYPRGVAPIGADFSPAYGEQGVPNGDGS